MGFGPIQFGGLASGLDTDSIITALLAVEALPIQSLEHQVDTANSKISLLGSLDTLLGTLKEKAEVLGSQSTFFAHTIAASGEGVANLTLTGSPSPGSHSLTVNSLAAAEVITWNGLVDKEAPTLLGSFDFTYGGGSAHHIDLTGLSLEGAAAAINADAGDEVTASIVNTGTSASPNYQLVLTGSETGSANQIVVADMSLTGQTELVNAADAQIVLDGLTITRETNVFSDVLEGVQIDALAADPAKTISFTVAVDNEGIKSKIQEMADAFNAVMDFINAQQDYTPGTAGTDDTGETGGVLFGDPVLSKIKQSITDAFFDIPLSAIQADTTGFSSPGLVGIEFDIDGNMSIDDAVMDAKMAEDLSAFVDLFADTDGFDNSGAKAWEPGYYVDSGTTDTGLADDLARKIEELLEDKKAQVGNSLPGLIQGRIDALNSNIGLWEDEIEDLEERLEDLEITLVNKFVALEELMAGLNSDGQFLAMHFSSKGNS